MCRHCGYLFVCCAVDQVNKATVNLSKMLAPHVKKMIPMQNSKEVKSIAAVAAHGITGALFYSLYSLVKPVLF